LASPKTAKYATTWKPESIGSLERNESRMKTVWFKGVEEKDKDERRTQVVTAANAFKVLTEILEDKIRTKEGERNTPKNYELPAYSEYQADVSGYIRALREVQSLLDI